MNSFVSDYDNRMTIVSNQNNLKCKVKIKSAA